MSESKSGKIVKELTLNDLATMIEDLQADLRLSLLNDEEIITKLDNINSSSNDGEYE